jgi:predicted RNase H-like HicB family nuclease
MSEQRDGEGRYSPTVSDEALLHYFDRGQRDFHSANEIATEFDFDRSQAHRRLSRLANRGELERVQIGRRNVVWWRPRDVIVLIEEDTGYSVLDRETGVASLGETRPEALRMLAEAIEVWEGDSAMAPEDLYEELDIDQGELSGDAAPPWE